MMKVISYHQGKSIIDWEDMKHNVNLAYGPIFFLGK